MVALVVGVQGKSMNLNCRISENDAEGGKRKQGISELFFKVPARIILHLTV